MPKMHKTSISGEVAKVSERGFWLYVWRVHLASGKECLYVGRTGDSSSPYAASPYKRIGQHLQKEGKANALYRRLIDKKIKLADCKSHEIFSYGPIYPEIGCTKGQNKKEQFEKHKPYRDIIAVLEKNLCDSLSENYCVLNEVKLKNENNEDAKNQWPKIKKAFSTHFPKIKK